jgi:hypothetical protein
MRLTRALSAFTLVAGLVATGAVATPYVYARDTFTLHNLGAESCDVGIG